MNNHKLLQQITPLSLASQKMHWREGERILTHQPKAYSE